MSPILKNNRIVGNAGWIVFCKIAQSVLSIVVTAISARFLGPSNYGIISYAASIVSFVSPIALLGISNVIVQELINSDNKDGLVLGTSITLSFISSFACLLGIFSFSLIANANQEEVTLVCVLYGLMLFFQSTELVVYWFQSKFLSKYSSVVSLIAYVIVSLYKIILLVNKVNIFWFALSNALDYLIISVVLILIFRKKTNQKLRFDKNIAKKIFNRSKHYIIPNLMIVIFTQTDQIMLKHMIDEKATGIYNAALTCAWMGSFVYTALIDSIRPAVFQNYKEYNLEKYEKSIIAMYSSIIYFGLFMGILLSFLSSFVIDVLYGSEYGDSKIILMVLAWLSLISNLGTVRNVWVLSQNKQKYLWIINASGAALNVVLNLFLIPIVGGFGAAIASLASQIFANVVVTFLFKPYRESFFLMCKGFNPARILDILKI